jgi:hypothetical protein
MLRLSGEMNQMNYRIRFWSALHRKVFMLICTNKVMLRNID